MGILVLVGILALGSAIAFFLYRHKLRRAKNIERGLKMVPLLINLPPASQDTQGTNRDVRDVMREKVSQAEALYNLITGTATSGFKSSFYGQRHIALELIAHEGKVKFFAAVPVAMVSIIENAIVTAYPGASVTETEEPNFFNPAGKINATAGGELVLREHAAYPIATIDKLDQDPFTAIINVLSSLSPEDGAGVQLLLRPARKDWPIEATRYVKKKQRKGSDAAVGYDAKTVIKALAAPPSEEKYKQDVAFTSGQQQVLDEVEKKAKKPTYEVLIRVVASSSNAQQAQTIIRNLASTFALFELPDSNGFKFLPAADVSGLVTAFIFRFFPPELNKTVLNTAELAGLFHLPDFQFSPNTDVERQASKQVDGPVNVPKEGIILGYNEFRGTKKEIHLSTDDRRRHTYIIGQTGTGKSTMLENLAVQDMLAGNGFCFIDPHGDTAEKLVSMVPKNRAEDIIYFNPGDMEYPLGFNLFEFHDPSQKDFIIQETINMLYKLYDPGHTGIIGPRYEHWFRNAALTLMSDPQGATFIEIPKVFTDNEFLKSKFKYVTDPTVVDFWTKEMAQTSDYHKSEMLGWFVSKFGAFQSNEMMRNIIGQYKSAFDMRDVMDNKKILIVNLSKGRVGELNSQLLGMMFVMKFQAAAMSRATMPEAERNDFCLYVDEFQNFSTDSFATILSEARKYRLNLVVANQYIGQLSEEIRDAVFGNVGTFISYRCSPEDAEILVKQFAPVFDALDITKLPNYQTIIRLMIGGLPSQPFSMAPLAPLGVANPELGIAIKQLSAAKFGLTKAAVEAEIFSRLSPKPAPAPAPAPAKMPEPALETTVPTPLPPKETVNPIPGPQSLPAEPAPAPVPIVQPEPAPAAAAIPPNPVPTPAPSPTPAPMPVPTMDITQPSAPEPANDATLSIPTRPRIAADKSTATPATPTPKPIPTPVTAGVGAIPETDNPQVAPGEVYVDENGNIIRG